MDDLDKHALRVSCGEFCKKLRAGSFDKDALAVWMEIITGELAPKEKEKKKSGTQESGQEPGNAASISLAQRKV